MANFFYLIFYIIRLALHWVRLAIYYFYGVVIFLAQPGARYLIPAALIATAYFGNAAIISSEAYFAASKRLFAWFPAMIDFLKDSDPWLIEPDGFLYAMAFLLSAAVYFGSPILQRLVATFPAMRRPLAPVLRRDPPKHVIRTAHVRSVVPKLSQRYWNGDHARLIERLPPAVEALLSPSEKDERPPVIDVTPPREVESAMIQPEPEAAPPSPVVLSSVDEPVSAPPAPDIEDNRPVQAEPKHKAHRTPLERKPASGTSLRPAQPKGKLVRPGKRRDPSIEAS